MKISDLVEELVKEWRKHGNLEVKVRVSGDGFFCLIDTTYTTCEDVESGCHKDTFVIDVR